MNPIHEKECYYCYYWDRDNAVPSSYEYEWCADGLCAMCLHESNEFDLDKLDDDTCPYFLDAEIQLEFNSETCQ
jgi:hypothetical protein